MSNKKESKKEAPKLKQSTAERLSAFYAWTAEHEFTIKDMEAVLCGVVIQAEIAGFSDSITIANRTFDIVVKERLLKRETKKESK